MIYEFKGLTAKIYVNNNPLRDAFLPARRIDLEQKLNIDDLEYLYRFCISFISDDYNIYCDDPNNPQLKGVWKYDLSTLKDIVNIKNYYNEDNIARRIAARGYSLFDRYAEYEDNFSQALKAIALHSAEDKICADKIANAMNKLNILKNHTSSKLVEVAILIDSGQALSNSSITSPPAYSSITSDLPPSYNSLSEVKELLESYHFILINLLADNDQRRSSLTNDSKDNEMETYQGIADQLEFKGHPQYSSFFNSALLTKNNGKTEISTEFKKRLDVLKKADGSHQINAEKFANIANEIIQFFSTKEAGVTIVSQDKRRGNIQVSSAAEEENAKNYLCDIFAVDKGGNLRLTLHQLILKIFDLSDTNKQEIGSKIYVSNNVFTDEMQRNLDLLKPKYPDFVTNLCEVIKNNITYSLVSGAAGSSLIPIQALTESRAPVFGGNNFPQAGLTPDRIDISKIQERIRQYHSSLLEASIQTNQDISFKNNFLAFLQNARDNINVSSILCKKLDLFFKSIDELGGEIVSISSIALKASKEPYKLIIGNNNIDLAVDCLESRLMHDKTDTSFNYVIGAKDQDFTKKILGNYVLVNVKDADASEAYASYIVPDDDQFLSDKYKQNLYKLNLLDGISKMALAVEQGKTDIRVTCVEGKGRSVTLAWLFAKICKSDYKVDSSDPAKKTADELLIRSLAKDKNSNFSYVITGSPNCSNYEESVKYKMLKEFLVDFGKRLVLKEHSADVTLEQKIKVVADAMKRSMQNELQTTVTGRSLINEYKNQASNLGRGV